MYFNSPLKTPFVPKTLEDLVTFLGDNLYYKMPTIDQKTGQQIYLGIEVPYDQTFIADIALKVMNGKSLSERQAQVVWKLVNKYLDFIVACNVDLDALSKLIENPKYRQPLYKSVIIPREIRYVGSSRFAVRFNFNPNVKGDLQSSVTECKWNEANKFWIVVVNKSNYDAFLRFVRKHKFEMDQTSLDVFKYMTSLQHGFEILEKDDKVIINVVENALLDGLLKMIWQENYEPF
jgi:hypothetical protein